MLDSHADIGATAGGPDGIFFHDTRYLSHLEMLLNGQQPLLLGSNVRDDNSILTVDLTNPDIYLDQKLVLPKDVLHVVRTLFLWRGAAYQRLRIAEPRRPAVRRAAVAGVCQRLRRPVRGARACAASAAAPRPRRIDSDTQVSAELSRASTAAGGARSSAVRSGAGSNSPAASPPMRSSCSRNEARSIYVTVKCERGADSSLPLPFRKGLRARIPGAQEPRAAA